MNLDQLRYLVDLASTGSMNVTAKNMYISQPAISDSIRRLENELNCTLFKRSKTGVTFTPEGELVLEAARRMVQEQNDLLSVLKRRTTEKSIAAEVNLWVGYSVDEVFLPKLLQEMETTYPNIQLNIVEMPFRHFSDEFLKNNEGIGLYGFMANSPADYPENIRHAFSFITLYQEPLVTVMSADHPLAKETDITDDKLLQYPATSIGFGYIEPLPENIRYITSNMEAHRQYLRNHQSTIMVPLSVYKKHFLSRAFISRIIEKKPLYRCLLLPKQFEGNMSVGYAQLIETAVQLSMEFQ